MNQTSRWFVLFFLIIAALLCYMIGFKIGFGIFLALGAIFELAFWVKLFKINKKE